MAFFSYRIYQRRRSNDAFLRSTILHIKKQVLPFGIYKTTTKSCRITLSNDFGARPEYRLLLACAREDTVLNFNLWTLIYANDNRIFNGNAARHTISFFVVSYSIDSLFRCSVYSKLSLECKSLQRKEKSFKKKLSSNLRLKNMFRYIFKQNFKVHQKVGHLAYYRHWFYAFW